MQHTGIIITLAYPETIVSVADEWYSSYLHYFGIGKKNYLRAGHAAMVVIEQATGVLEYYDFGRYITPEPMARVRGRDTDHELYIPLKATLKEGKIENLEQILKYLATHPEQTHGNGTLYASVCYQVDYAKAKAYITTMQNKHFIRYAAFIKEACNCVRFVTNTLLSSVTNKTLINQLKRSKWFTPSTLGNVVTAANGSAVYQVSDKGTCTLFSQSVFKVNSDLFLDRLPHHVPNKVGTIHPKPNCEKKEHAQWLPGIAAGAWFELYKLNGATLYRFRRVSPYGHVDVDGVYKISDPSFNYELPYQFVPYSNCLFFHVRQHELLFKFDFIELYAS